ncbi:MAG: hypothetical protein ACPHER_04095 [Nevskiales bacterium]
MLHEDTLEAYKRLSRWVAERVRPGYCPIIGISGAQGSGKSTLARFLVETLQQDAGLRCAVLSIDDCYLSYAERQQLAREQHPLLATRGVPGTHDAWLGMRLLKQLRELGAEQSLPVPQFSKAEDDRLLESAWPLRKGPVDLILFEGWCVGIPPETAAALQIPVNHLEQHEDPDCRWRQYVNQQLAGPYADWFAMLDYLVFLQIPDFSQVGLWRGQQEAETAAQAGQGKGLMSPATLQRFIQHYERLTRHALSVLPAAADVCLSLGEQHEVLASHYRQ